MSQIGLEAGTGFFSDLGFSPFFCLCICFYTHVNIGHEAMGVMNAFLLFMVKCFDGPVTPFFIFLYTDIF